MKLYIVILIIAIFLLVLFAISYLSKNSLYGSGKHSLEIYEALMSVLGNKKYYVWVYICPESHITKNLEYKIVLKNIGSTFVCKNPKVCVDHPILSLNNIYKDVIKEYGGEVVYYPWWMFNEHGNVLRECIIYPYVTLKTLAIDNDRIVRDIIYTDVKNLYIEVSKLHPFIVSKPLNEHNFESVDYLTQEIVLNEKYKSILTVDNLSFMYASIKISEIDLKVRPIFVNLFEYVMNFNNPDYTIKIYNPRTLMTESFLSDRWLINVMQLKLKICFYFVTDSNENRDLVTRLRKDLSDYYEFVSELENADVVFAVGSDVILREIQIAIETRSDYSENKGIKRVVLFNSKTSYDVQILLTPTSAYVNFIGKNHINDTNYIMKRVQNVVVDSSDYEQILKIIHPATKRSRKIDSCLNDKFAPENYRIKKTDNSGSIYGVTCGSVSCDLKIQGGEPKYNAIEFAKLNLPCCAKLIARDIIFNPHNKLQMKTCSAHNESNECASIVHKSYGSIYNSRFLFETLDMKLFDIVCDGSKILGADFVLWLTKSVKIINDNGFRATGINLKNIGIEVNIEDVVDKDTYKLNDFDLFHKFDDPTDYGNIKYGFDTSTIEYILMNIMITPCFEVEDREIRNLKGIVDEFRKSEITEKYKKEANALGMFLLNHPNEFAKLPGFRHVRYGIEAEAYKNFVTLNDITVIETK